MFCGRKERPSFEIRGHVQISRPCRNAETSRTGRSGGLLQWNPGRHVDRRRPAPGWNPDQGRSSPIPVSCCFYRFFLLWDKNLWHFILRLFVSTDSVQWVEPVQVKLKNNLTLYSHPPPGSGVLTAYIMRLLDGHLDSSPDGIMSSDHPVTHHRIAEAFKHAFAQRTKLGDPRFHPEMNQVI